LLFAAIGQLVERPPSHERHRLRFQRQPCWRDGLKLRDQPVHQVARVMRATNQEMREMGVRGVLIYCADYRCSLVSRSPRWAIGDHGFSPLPKVFRRLASFSWRNETNCWRAITRKAARLQLRIAHAFFNLMGLE
jgi:hypothetical protein